MVNQKETERAIRQFAAAGRITYTNHARERLEERGIQQLDIQKALKNGQVVDARIDGPDILLSFQDSRAGTPEFYVVARVDDRVFVITVCHPSANCWEICEGFLKRSLGGL